ncbi:tyrosine aminotransferase-like isoform X1 [Varroa jacobsoni]|uniref:tyrosine aminotransferase-like isoform X1 n=1 Tax=Varroa jacobsoni TaxID=62625 RepID=UPI000BF5304C|nr:tyrosine aminotransferase-like isoform X1 [Varroa jacobsoni]XP_022688579.1 tyrosine aminotransferase-like isoform X1 [Varroa jacobsoni]XP_022688580.1 tyrosine aminotransferase-like isoform X1 [Varroa jacobsoni]
MEGNGPVSIRSKKISHEGLRDGAVYVNGHCLSNRFYDDEHRPERSWDSVDASDFAKKTFNPIRVFVEDPDLQPNPEKDVISLSIGDPTIFGNLKPCPEIVDAVERALRSMKCHGYIPSAGTYAARAAVAKYSAVNGIEIDPSDVILTCGASHALEMCVMCFCNPGENVLVPRPGFSVYKTHANSVGIEAIFYDLDPAHSWQVDLRSLRGAINNRTRAILVNNPSNPCGSVYSKEHLKDILEIAKEHRLPIIADEIYEHFVFSGRIYHPLASLSTDVPIVSCSGLTKRFLVPGWRTGWIIIHDRKGILTPIKKGLIALSQKIMGGSALIQGAITDILTQTPQSFYDDTVKVVEDNATLAFNAISSIPGLKPVMPQGAMYMMVGVDLDRFKEFSDDAEFCKELFRQESVFCMPGKAFSYPNYFRIVLTVPQDMILDACDRVSAFCERHAKYF